MGRILGIIPLNCIRLRNRPWEGQNFGESMGELCKEMGDGTADPDCIAMRGLRLPFYVIVYHITELVSPNQMNPSIPLEHCISEECSLRSDPMITLLKGLEQASVSSKLGRCPQVWLCIGFNWLDTINGGIAEICDKNVQQAAVDLMTYQSFNLFIFSVAVDFAWPW